MPAVFNVLNTSKSSVAQAAHRQPLLQAQVEQVHVGEPRGVEVAVAQHQRACQVVLPLHDHARIHVGRSDKVVLESRDALRALSRDDGAGRSILRGVRTAYRRGRHRRA
jgi:hypothetical protein